VFDRPAGVVAIRYYDETGADLFVRERNPDGVNPRFRQPAKVKLQPYGLHRLDQARRAGQLVLCEGESDAWTLWYHKKPALGLPGGSAYDCLQKEQFVGIDQVYILPDNDLAGEQMVKGTLQRLAQLGYRGKVCRLRLPEEFKDVSDLHVADPDAFPDRLVEMLEHAEELSVAPSAGARGATTPGASAPGPGPAPDPPRESASTRLVRLALDAGLDLYHDQQQAPYADVVQDGCRHTWPMRSGAMRDWLARLAHRCEGRVPGSQAIADALNVLCGQAVYDGPERFVAVRVAEHQGRLYLDLADPGWRAVEIRPDGWNVVQAPPVRFRRSRGTMPLPQPDPTGSLDLLRPLVNVTTDDGWRLVVAWLAACLRPAVPFPLLALTGEQGSAKSTLARTLRSLIDPNVAPLRAAPRDERDLAIAAANSWLCALDNLSWLPGWLSDALCRLCTGGAITTRELYSNRDEVIFDARRPVLLASIADVVSAPDLLDRTILLDLEPIPDHSRRTEAELARALDDVRPRVLGGLLNAVSAGLRLLPSVRLDRLPRMADFSLWGEAVWQGLGASPGALLEAYQRSIGAANSTALESSPVALAVLRLMAGVSTWEGTASELLGALEGVADEATRKQRGWPSRSNALSAALRKAAPNLRRCGVEFTTHRRSGERTIRLERHPTERESEASSSSSSSSSDACAAAA
jgi:hypothetical protein